MDFNKQKLIKRLRELREEKKLTQKELAAILNVTRSSIGQYENGEVDLSTDLLYKYAEFFNVTTDYLLGKSNSPDEHLTIIQEAIRVARSDKDIEYVVVMEEAKENEVSAQEIRDFINIVKKRKKID